MNVILTFKTPDVVELALEGLEYVSEEKADKMREVISKWVSYGELVQIVIDVNRETAEVVRVG